MVGAEARGFIVGAAVALRLGAGFVPLPQARQAAAHGAARVLCAGIRHRCARDSRLTRSPSRRRGVIVDDLVATGGTTTAMVRLVRASGARLAGLGFVMELAFLNPRAAIAAETDAEVFSLVAVE